MMDVIELNLLSGLEDKRNRQARVDHQQDWGLKQMAALATPSQNGSTVTAAGTPAPTVNPLPSASVNPELIAQPKGIMNRSPITYNHYYTQPSGTTVVEPPPASARDHDMGTCLAVVAGGDFGASSRRSGVVFIDAAKTSDAAELD